MIKHCLWALLCSAATLLAIAQPGPLPEKTLLWRISGKGLRQPSYLYGTMHLPDERLFLFGDSLLQAIEKTEGFAIEVDPDEMMTVVMEEAINNNRPSRLLKEVVSRRAYDRYGPILAKRLKKPAATITVKDVVQEQHKWMQEAYSKGAMPTFVDVWLFDLARRQGKWVGGIEDIQDQAGLMEDVFNEQDLEFLTTDFKTTGKKLLEAMIEAYAREDLPVLAYFSEDRDDRRNDLLLLRRNAKMARRMDSLSAIRTMVFAVGAAHLPGDSGVISLLRKSGFEVTPVFSSRKIAGKDHPVMEKPLAWHRVADRQGLYTVEMPGKASLLKVHEVVDMHMNINLFTSSGYFVMAIPVGGEGKDMDAQLLGTARNMLQNPKLKQGIPVTNNGIKGWEYIGKKAGEYKRLQLFGTGQICYAAFATFNREEGLNGADAGRFFQSLALYAPRAEADTVKMISFAGLLPGLQGAAPVVLDYNRELTEKVSEKGYETRAYMGVDAIQGAAYLLINKNTAEGTYLIDDTAYFGILRARFQTKVAPMTLDTTWEENGGFVMEQRGMYIGQEVLFYSKTLMQGNRVLNLTASVPPGKKSEERARQVIRSFHLGTAPATAWATHDHGKQFSTWAPAPLQLQILDSTEADQQTSVYNARDTNSSYVYSVVRSPLDTSNWYNSREAYWEALLKQYENSESDTIFRKTATAANGLEGYLLDIRKKTEPRKTKRYRFFTYGDTLYTLFSCLPLAAAENENVQRFFTDFRFSRPAPPATVFTSKARAFLDRLSAADSIVYDFAYNRMYSANFTREDIPLLRQALLQHYAWDTGANYYQPVHTRIGAKLVNLGDSALGQFVQDQYRVLNGRDVEEQTSLLPYVLADTGRASIRFVIDALQQVDEKDRISDGILYQLHAPAVKPFVPEILSLLNKQNMTGPLIGFARMALDSNLIKPQDLLLYEPALIRFANEELAKINSGEAEDYGLYGMADIAGQLNTAPAMALLNRMLACRQNGVKLEGIEGLLKAGAPIPEPALLAVAADRSLRQALLRSLLEKQQEALFPKKYKTQQAIAESGLDAYIRSDDEEVADMVYLAMRTVTIHTTPVNIYFFKVALSAEKDRSYYLSAIACPAALKNLEPLQGSENMLWETPYDPKKQEKQMRELVEMIRENMAEE